VKLERSHSLYFFVERREEDCTLIFDDFPQTVQFWEVEIESEVLPRFSTRPQKPYYLSIQNVFRSVILRRVEGIPHRYAKSIYIDDPYHLSGISSNQRRAGEHLLPSSQNLHPIFKTLELIHDVPYQCRNAFGHYRLGHGESACSLD
jgi:hypothetical protein